MGTERSGVAWWQPILEWQYENARSVLEGTLDSQRRVVDQWTETADSTLGRGLPVYTPVRTFDWGYDVWEETVRNGLIHLDSAITEEGIDLQKLQMIWLQAMDDAINEVMSRPAVASEASRDLERTLEEQQQWNQLRRDLLHASNMPTDRDLEEVGERLLQLEARQKNIEEKLDAILVENGIEVGTPLGAVE